MFEREGVLYGLPPGGAPVELLRHGSNIGDFRRVAPGQALLSLPTIPDTYAAPRSFHLVSWEGDFRSPSVRELFREDEPFEVEIFYPWTDEEAVLLELRGRKANTLTALDLDTGARRKLTDDRLQVVDFAIHPSGVLFVVDKAGRSLKSANRVFVVDLHGGQEHELGSLEGPLVNWTLDADWTRVVYNQVLGDTNGDREIDESYDEGQLYLSML